MTRQPSPHMQNGEIWASYPTGRTPPANNSAWSENAKPEEDWTKISDLAERRRIQNRIAQRNYRKKLKARLAQYESCDTEKPTPVKKSGKKSPTAKTTKRKQTSSPQMKPTPPMDAMELPFGYDDQNPSYSTPRNMFPACEPQDLVSFVTQPYHSVTTGENYTHYPTTGPSGIPSMTHFRDAYPIGQGQGGVYYTNYYGDMSMGPYEDSSIYNPRFSSYPPVPLSSTDSEYDFRLPTPPLTM